MSNLKDLVPDIKISVNQIFGIDTEMKVNGFSKRNIGEGYLEIANHKSHYIKKQDLTSFNSLKKV